MAFVKQEKKPLELEPTPAEVEKLELSFTAIDLTKNKVRFEENLPPESLSAYDVASGAFYIYQETLRLLGNPARIKITVEPLGESTGK